MTAAPNTARVAHLASHIRTPRYALGQLVREPYGEVGVVDTIYADLEAAHDKGFAGLNADAWYAAQRKRPKTPKTGIWYAVILASGAVLAGEDDLKPVGS